MPLKWLRPYPSSGLELAQLVLVALADLCKSEHFAQHIDVLGDVPLRNLLPSDKESSGFEHDVAEACQKMMAQYGAKLCTAGSDPEPSQSDILDLTLRAVVDLVFAIDAHSQESLQELFLTEKSASLLIKAFVPYRLLRSPSDPIYAGVTPRLAAGRVVFLSYLAMTINTTDDLAALQVLNNPQRGLDAAALRELFEESRRTKLSLTQAIISYTRRVKLKARFKEHLESPLNPYREPLARIADTIDELNTTLFEHTNPATLVKRALFILRKELTKCATAAKKDCLCSKCFGLQPRAPSATLECMCLRVSDIQRTEEYLMRRYEHHVASGTIKPAETNADTLARFLEAEASASPSLSGPFGEMPLATPSKDTTTNTGAAQATSNENAAQQPKQPLPPTPAKSSRSPCKPAHATSAQPPSRCSGDTPAKRGKARPLVTPSKTPRDKGPKQARVPLGDQSNSQSHGKLTSSFPARKDAGVLSTAEKKRSLWHGEIAAFLERTIPLQNCSASSLDIEPLVADVPSDLGEATHASATAKNSADAGDDKADAAVARRPAQARKHTKAPKAKKNNKPPPKNQPSILGFMKKSTTTA